MALAPASPTPAHPSTALVRSNIRKYGGCLTVPEPLPCPLAFQLVDLKVLDPNELVETSVHYPSYAKRDSLYTGAPAPDPELNDPSHVVLLGRTELGHSICVRVPFRPYVFLYVADVHWEAREVTSLRHFLARVLSLEPEDLQIEPQTVKRLDGWVPAAHDPTRTEEVVVLRVTVPNKKLLDRMTDLVDPTKPLEKLLRGTLKRLRDDLLASVKYSFVSKGTLEKYSKDLEMLDKRLMAWERNIERARSTPGAVAPHRPQWPSAFASPSPLPDPGFCCPALLKIWASCNDRVRRIHQRLAWWKQTGYKLPSFKAAVHPLLWESSVDPVHKFCDQTRIVPSGWVELTEYTRPDGYISHCQIECTTTLSHLRPVERPTIAPLLMASVDGEMYSSKPSSFPNPLRAADPVITIGVVLCRTNSPDLERFVFCLRHTDASQVTNATVFQFNDESELLKAWRDFMVVDADPDVVTGYNILGFDWKYFAHRAAKTYETPEVAQQLQQALREEQQRAAAAAQSASSKARGGVARGGEDEREDEDDPDDEEDDEEEEEEEKNTYDEMRPTLEHPLFARQRSAALPLSPPPPASPPPSTLSDETILESSSKTKILGPTQQISRFFRLSRIWAEITPCLPKVFKSSAYGERWSYHLHMTGRAIQDLLVYIRREHKLESYKLDHVAFHFLKDRKIDLEPKLLFQYFDAGPRERGLIAEYCVKDCVLPLQLCKHAKLMVVPNLVEMSRVTFTPLPQLINGGQQIKVFNQLVWYAHLGGFVMNDQPPRDVEGYEGATVLDPLPGWYNCPVTVLDFASLYPSLIINQNLCYSTLVREDRYKNLPGVQYHTIQIGSREHVFVANTVLKGVLPTLEQNLLAARRSVKKQMKTETDKDVYAMLDAKQLAIKVSCNSVYGFTGANNGMYPEPAIAESITATGRKYIERSKQYVLDHYAGSSVLYGDTDSIFIRFDVTPNEEGLARSFELGREAAAAISQLFGEAMSLEMEKVYFPYLLYGKKRYIGLKYEEPEKFKGLDTKGIEIIRRDWSPLVRTIYKQCIDKVFFGRDVEGASRLLQQYCQDMIDDKLEFDWFVMSKELKSQYAHPETQVHVAVVKQIAQRTPGSEPQVGDRVPFVIVRKGHDYHIDAKKNKTKLCLKISEKAEDPAYVKAHRKQVSLDYIYYLEKQVRRPLTNFFAMFWGEKRAEGLFAPVLRQLANEYAGHRRGGLMDFFAASPECVLTEENLTGTGTGTPSDRTGAGTPSARTGAELTPSAPAQPRPLVSTSVSTSAFSSTSSSASAPKRTAPAARRTPPAAPKRAKPASAAAAPQRTLMSFLQ